MAITCDYLVIGSGVAGLTFALEASAHGDIVLVTKRSKSDSNTQYAQGGIAAVLGDDDSFEAHIEDTLLAGAGLCHERAVEVCVKDGPARIGMLERYGARFDRRQIRGEDAPRLDLHLEGAHRARRIAHVRDMTGREVERALLDGRREQPARAHPRGAHGRRPHHALEVRRARGLRGRVRARRRRGAGRHDPRARHRPRDGRGRQGLPLHDQPRRRDRRRGRDGVPRGRRDRRTWSSTSFTRPASTTRRPRASSSPRRCAARGRSSAARRHGVHEEARPARRPRPA